jgi:hypothetical protein
MDIAVQSCSVVWKQDLVDRTVGVREGKLQAVDQPVRLLRGLDAGIIHGNGPDHLAQASQHSAWRLQPGQGFLDAVKTIYDGPREQPLFEHELDDLIGHGPGPTCRR